MTRVALADALRTDLEATGGLLLEGEPGIGKTHLLAQLVAAARADGVRVLTAQPIEAETRLAGGGLIDLLRDVGDEEVGRLPRPQCEALLAALLRADGGGTPPDPGIVPVALTSLLDRLGETGPVLVAVDNLQWLDPTTASALGYAARRSTGEVTFALTLRTPVEELPSPAAELAAVDRLHRHPVGPLDAQSIGEIVLDRCGREVPRTVVARAIETSAGNPFYAVELARMWAGAETDGRNELPIPSSLRALVGARLESLGEASLAAVTTASAMARPSLAVLRGLGFSDEDVLAAERAGVLTVARGAVRFTHPLLAAAAYDRLTGTERAALHRRLTGVVRDVELRARHLALGAEGPDEEVAAALDAAGDSATARGDVFAATDAARLAIEATPPGSALLPDRELRLARLLFVYGDAQAQPILERLTDPATPDHVKVWAQITMCELAVSTISHEAAQEFGRDAVETATRIGDDTLLAEAHIYLAQAYQFDPVRARQHAVTAQQLLEAQDDPDPSQLAKALALSAGIDFNIGRGLDHGRLQRAKDLEDSVRALAEDRMTGYYAANCVYADDLDVARDLIADWVAVNAEHGYERDQTVVLMWSAAVELITGNLDAAEALANEHLAHARMSGQAQAARFASYNLGQVALSRGDFAAAAEIGAVLVHDADAGAGARVETLGRRLAGEAALLLGDHVAAAAHLNRVEELRNPELCDPHALAHLPRLVEAKVALGQPVAAELDYYEQQARSLDRPSALALAARCRALVALGLGDQAATVDALDEAIRYHQKTGYYPVELVRTLLLKAHAMRRFRRRGDARAALQEASELSTSIGAPGWLEVIVGELDRTGVRAAGGELTATEQKVAELAARGRTNKEIAAELYLSPKTVEVHLTHVYRKLGVRSRTELGARL
jgi:DNA-binding NarL/FixJ family response regulator